jgi:hypothetical protein
LVKFGGPWNEEYFMNIWNILRPFGIFTAIWYNLWPFGIVCDHLVYFLRFGMFGPIKIWQPSSRWWTSGKVWQQQKKQSLLL